MTNLLVGGRCVAGDRTSHAAMRSALSTSLLLYQYITTNLMIRHCIQLGVKQIARSLKLLCTLMLIKFIIRNMMACTVTGQGAGAAAAVSIKVTV